MSLFDNTPDRIGTNSTKWDGPGCTREEAGRIPMWVADTDFAVMPEITAALNQRSRHPVFGYTIAPDGFYQSFISWNRRRNGIKLEKDWLLRSCGVIATLKAAIMACTKEGEKIVVQTPVYPPFMGAVAITKRTLVPNPLRNTPEGYQMDLAHLEHCFKQGAKMLLLCNPHNPVGRVWTKKELGSLLALCARYGVVVFSDEIHSDIIFSTSRFTSALSLLQAGQWVIAGASPGKAFNISGLKTSFAIAPDPLLRKKLYEAMDIFGVASCNLFGYAASEAAYTYGDAWVEEMTAYIEQNYRLAAKYLAENLPQIKATPLQGTFLLWLDFSACGLEQQQLMAQLRDGAGVVLNNGADFGPEGNGHARMNLGCSKQTLQRALGRIAKQFTQNTKGQTT